MERWQCDRRTVLRATGALAVGATAGLAGCGGNSGGGTSSTTSSGSGGNSGGGTSSTTSSGSGGSSSFGGWFGGSKGGKTSNYNGTTVDKTGQSSVTIKVGAQGNGGSYAFSPAAVKISSGTKVTFHWVSNTHNIRIQAQPSGANWQGESQIKNKGYTYTHTFNTTGTYKYYCEPHLSLGMKGAIVVA